MSPSDTELAQFKIEIELAEKMQQNLLSSPTPDIPGLDIFAAYRPQHYVGGDLYDFIVATDQRFTFIVSDICGNGIAAAIMMSMARLAFRVSVSQSAILSPEEIFYTSNAILYEDFSRLCIFASAFIGSYNPATRVLTYANAGQSPVIMKPAGGKARLIMPDEAPIGVSPFPVVKNKHLRLRPGDVFLVGSDGLAEAYAEPGDVWSGYRELIRKTNELSDQPAKTIAEELFSINVRGDQSNFNRVPTQPQDQIDDQTLVVIKGY